jgi:L-malate glycosyltransferase
MNILICCEFFHPSVGGVEKVTLELAKNFISKGHIVSIATSKFDNKLPKYQIFHKIMVHRFNISGNYKKGITGKYEIYQNFLRNSKFDVVLFYAAQQWTFDLALPILDQINSNLYLATCGFSGLKKNGYKKYFQLVINKMKNINKNIVHSNNYIDINFLKKNNIKNNILVPNAADNDFKEYKNKNFFKSNKIKKAKKNILNISNYKFNKGQDLSILIFFLLNFKEDINLIFIGEKFNSKTYYLYLYFLKLITEFFFKNKKIYFLEKLVRKNVVSAFFNHDVFLFTSRLECSPLVLFESAAAGLPFISLNSGNSYEVAKWTQAGRVCTNIFQASKYLNFYLKNDKYCFLLSKNGKDNYLKKFNWKIISAKYIKIFKKYNF